MKFYDKEILISLTKNIEKLCEQQSSRNPAIYDMFTKLEGRIQVLENKIIELEAKIESINVNNDDEDTVPVRRDCSLCIIS